MSKRLSGKIALVTGGISGIGAAIVSRFLDEGAIVHILDKNIPDSFESKTNDTRARKPLWSASTPPMCVKCSL